MQRVDVKVSRLLEIAAVRADLPVHLRENDLAPRAHPSGRAGQGREERSQGMQRYGLAQEVCVGREVHGEVVLQKAAVLVQSSEEAAPERIRHAGAGDPPKPG